MHFRLSNDLFKKILVLFWSAWWLIAVWTDVVGGLAHLGILHASWAPDLNYVHLVESLKMYYVPAWVPLALFIGILFWSLLSTMTFFWATLAIIQGRENWLYRAQNAYIISLAYWLAFFIADQLVMKFDIEQNHMVQGGFQLLCFLAMYLLPSASTQRKFECRA